MELNGRAKVGDDPDDITDTNYGNNDVSGPEPDKEAYQTRNSCCRNYCRRTKKQNWY